jgi:homogentisate 1,2-dioxygenase
LVDALKNKIMNCWIQSSNMFYAVQATISRGNNVGPHKITDTLAFMFESSLIPRISRSALESPFLDHDYYQCWIGLKSHFTVPETSLESLTLNNGQ